MEKNHSIFQGISKWIPPYRDCKHQIEPIPRSIPPKTKPYRYPYQQKEKIKKLVKELLDLVQIELLEL